MSKIIPSIKLLGLKFSITLRVTIMCHPYTIHMPDLTSFKQTTSFQNYIVYVSHKTISITLKQINYILYKNILFFYQINFLF